MATAKTREPCNRCLSSGSIYTFSGKGAAQRMTEHNCPRCGGRGSVPAGTRNPHNPRPRATKPNGAAARPAAKAAAPKTAKPSYAVGDRVAVMVKGKRTPGTVRALWKAKPEYGRQIGDLLVEIRPGGGALWYSPADASHLKGGAGKGATTVRVPTMAEVKAKNKEYHQKQGHDWSYFDRKTSRLFGPEKFYGPYAGPGGVYFVVDNKGGLGVKRANPKGDIDPVGVPVSSWGLEEVRAYARAKAAGTN